MAIWSLTVYITINMVSKFFNCDGDQYHSVYRYWSSSQLKNLETILMVIYTDTDHIAITIKS
jgi:hypothetical protein